MLIKLALYVHYAVYVIYMQIVL